ncbi:hypothetical protein M758_4G007500 [Ceratodon purpureus]|nr:hypothetical protein M758_4G007500 [Ceratodon purpureus]
MSNTKMAPSTLVVLVALLVMMASSTRVESNPGMIWTTSNADSGDTSYPAVDFLFEENTPIFGDTGYVTDSTAGFSDTAESFDDTAYGVDAVDSFDNAGFSDSAQGDVTGITATPAKMAQGFVRTRGMQFVLNGKPIFVNGANLYYLMSYAGQPSQRSIVTDILRESASVGVTVVRTWAFADGDGNYNLQVRPGVYSEQTFRGLDFVVSEAKKFGIRLIMSFVNNYPDYGGRQQYMKWARANGNWNAQLDDFYTDGVMRSWYKNHIRRVVTRVNTFTGVAYRDDPTIFSWELINEPRCESDRSGNKLQRWIREMAVYVKSLDNKHMLEVGLEGFYSPIANPNSVNSQAANPASYAANFGTDFTLNGQPKEIDFTTVHSYPDSWVPNRSENDKRAFMASWIKTHINDAQYRLRKPVMFAEFGRSDRAPGYNQRMRINDMTDMFNAVYSSASTGGPAAGTLVWQLLPRALKYSNQDGYGIVLSENPTVASLMSKQSYRMSRL